VSHRPLVFVTGLTVGDYLLWNWSLNGNHTVLALVSGLTLPPLAVACLWLLTMTVARLIAHSARRPHGRAARTRHARRGAHHIGKQSRRAAAAGRPLEEPPATTTPAGSPSRKLAA
jgi:hypothetical protein